LMPTRKNHAFNHKVWWIVIINIGIFVIYTTILTSRYRCLRRSIEHEKEQWRRELQQRRLEEKSRIDEWERMFSAAREENRQQVKRWQGELMERHLEEQRRIGKWEIEFDAKREQNRQEWQRELEGRHLEEQSRIDRWERTFNATQERTRRQMEKWRREDEEMQRLGLHWDELTVDSHCTGYNTREYWARLSNTVPYDYNWLKPCEDIPNDIHGRSMKTTRCYANPFVSGEVIGHWSVNFNEPLCTPFWDQFEDKGCTAEGSGRRRLLAHLVNIHDGEDGEKLCSSTPLDFHGRHFDGPHSCVNWGSGIYGFWEFDDSNC